MSALPWDEVLVAVRTGGNQAGALPLRPVVDALLATPAASIDATVLALARLAAGPSADTATAREIEIDLGALAGDALGLARVLAPSLASVPKASEVVGHAFAGIVHSASAVIGAVVPWSVAIDATLLQACRASGASWGPPALAAGTRERAEELARRVALSLGVRVATTRKNETPEESLSKLEKLDLARVVAASRAAEIERRVREGLPKV